MPENSRHRPLANVPLQLVLIAPFVVLTVLFAGLVGYVSFRNGKQAVNNVAHQLRRETTSRIREHLRAFLETPHRINEINGKAIHDGLLDTDAPDVLAHWFWDQVRTYDSVTSLYYGNTEGGLVLGGREGPDGGLYVILTDGFVKGPFRKHATDDQGNRKSLIVTVPDFDARNRSWYKNAVEKKGPAWSDVYILFTEQDMAIAASRPVYDDEQNLRGVLSIDIFVSHISAFLQSLRFGETGLGFVMERSGLLVASSADEKPFVQDETTGKQRRIFANESKIPGIRHTAAFLKKEFGDNRNIRDVRHFEFDIDGRRQFLEVSPVRDEHGIDWLVAVVVPESDFMGQIIANNRMTVIFIVLALAIAIFVGIIAARFVTRPISRLNAYTKALAQGDFKPIEHANRISELAGLTLSFNNMATRLEQTMDNLKSEIAEREKAQKTLAKSEKNYRELVQNANSAILRLDNDGRITFFNDFAQRLFGFSEQDIIGQKAVGTIVSETDSAGVDLAAKMADLCTYPDMYSSSENENVCKDGRRVWMSWTNRAICDENGVQVEILSVGNDITKRKQLESRLRQAHKMEAIGTLAGGIAHDFNNILGIIIGNTELAMDDIPDWNRARPFLHEVLTASLRAKDVVRQLLGFTRTMKQKAKPVRIATIIKEALSLLKSSTPATIDIQLNIETDADMVLAESTQIHQILINLCANALHAMRKNGGSLQIGLSDAEVDGNASERLRIPPGKYVKLSVGDTGHGIAPETKNRIFDPYFTTKEVGEGSGMGLAIVHGIVKAHGGSISVNNGPEKGTVFDILFPKIETDTVGETDPVRVTPSGNGSILFVDDDKDIVAIQTHTLQRLGYRVQSFTRPDEALELFQSDPEQFDVVITDMTMPIMTGDDLARKILKIRPDIPIIICTGRLDHVSEKKAGEIGIRTFAMKPLERHQLAEILAEIMR